MFICIQQLVEFRISWESATHLINNSHMAMISLVHTTPQSGYNEWQRKDTLPFFWKFQLNIILLYLFSSTTHPTPEHIMGVYAGNYACWNIGLFAYFAVVLLYSGTLKAAEDLHNDLLKFIMRAPVCNFFDITPIGRLLNHFSGDMEIIDEELPGTLDSFFTIVFMVSILF